MFFCANGRRQMLRVALCAVVAVLECVYSQNLPPEMANSAVGKKPTRLAKSEPYVKCTVCKMAAGEAWALVDKKAKTVPYGKIGEMEIGDIIESVCDPDDDNGEWMTYYDIVQNETSAPMELTKQEHFGECRRECTTIAHACRAILDEHRDDMTEMLFKHFRKADEDSKPSKQKEVLTLAKYSSRVCKKLSSACPGKTVPKGFKHRDEKWMPLIDEEGFKMRKMQYHMNKAAKETGSQPVQFLDPMGSMFQTHDDEM